MKDYQSIFEKETGIIISEDYPNNYNNEQYKKWLEQNLERI